MSWIKPRSKPRRGEVHMPPFMEFARSQGCVLRGRAGHKCLGPITFHHVRSHGSPKDDTSGFGLCAFGHLHTYNSRTSIEALGKEKFQLYWGVSIEQEIRKLQVAFAVQGIIPQANESTPGEEETRPGIDGLTKAWAFLMYGAVAGSLAYWAMSAWRQF